MPALIHLALRRDLFSALALLLFSILNACSGPATSPKVPPVPTPRSSPGTFYLDCSAAGPGSGTQSSPWNSLARVNAFAFIPGDQLLLNRGTTCNGSLTPQGSGSATAPIVIDAYGTGAQPAINGGSAQEAVMLFNQQYWEINNLEVVGGNLYGVYISGNTPNVATSPSHSPEELGTFTERPRPSAPTPAKSSSATMGRERPSTTFSSTGSPPTTATSPKASWSVVAAHGSNRPPSLSPWETTSLYRIPPRTTSTETAYSSAETTNGLLQNNVVYNSGLCTKCTGSTPVGLWLAFQVALDEVNAGTRCHRMRPFHVEGNFNCVVTERVRVRN